MEYVKELVDPIVMCLDHISNNVSRSFHLILVDQILFKPSYGGADMLCGQEK